MAGNPNVLMITQLFMPSIGGGSENQAIYLAKRITSKGFNVTVFARRIKGEPIESVVDRIKVIRLWNLNWSLIRRGMESFLLGVISSLSYACALGLEMILYRKDFDIVHYCGAGLPTAITAPVVRLLGKKSVAHITGLSGVEAGSIGKGRVSLAQRPFTWLINFVDAFRASGSLIENGLIEDGIAEEKIFRIPNLVDTNIFYPVDDSKKKALRDRLNLPSEAKIAAFAGILIKSKGVDFLLKIWKKMVESHKDLHLVIVGDGPEKKHLANMITEYGIDERVRLVGLVGNVNEYLQASDVFVFASRHPEGTPNAVLEAMSCGLPVVTTKVGNLEDFIKDGVNAVFIDANNLDGCVQRLQLLLSDETLCQKLSCNAVKTIRNNNDPESVCQKYIELYKKLLSEKAEAKAV